MRDIVSPLDGVISPLRRRSGFAPISLFASGEQGVLFDFSDFSTMFQDAAGTTPVTAVEQPVGLIRDKSGRGNHASQSISTSRPVLKQDGNGKYYLLFDGVDDSLATSTINPGSVDKVQVFAGVRKLSDAATGMVAEFGPLVDTTNGTFAMLAPGTNGTRSYRFASCGTAFSAAGTGVFAAAPNTSVLTGIGDISGDVTTLRRNEAVVETSFVDQGTGNYTSQTLNIGRRANATLPFNGNLYGLIVRFSAANLDDATIGKAETWMNSKTGAY